VHSLEEERKEAASFLRVPPVLVLVSKQVSRWGQERRKRRRGQYILILSLSM